MRIYVNGILMREGETRTVTSLDHVQYMFVGPPDAPGGTGGAEDA